MDNLSIMVLIIGTCLIISGTVDQWFKYKHRKLQLRYAEGMLIPINATATLPTHVLSPEITELIKSECVMHKNALPTFVSLTVDKHMVTVKYEAGGKQYSHAFAQIQHF